MAFWVRNTSGGTYVVDDLGTTFLTAEERDLHLANAYEILQDSADLVAALAAGDLTRLDGPGGSPIPAAQAFDDATALHMIGGAAHTSSTLAEVNALISDATLDDAGDPRTPTAHAASHLQAGSDPIDLATPTVAGIMSAADKAKLDDLSVGNLLIPVRNETGSPIAINKLVASAGWSIANNCVIIRLADKDIAGASPAIGVTTSAIADGANGEALIAGCVVDIDTSTWVLTDQLVLGNNGDFLRPPPSQDPFTGEVQNVGSVTRVDATEGRILFIPDGVNVITPNQVFALAGTAGTPSKTNKYVTDSDPRLVEPVRALTVGSQGCDYTSIKAAVDAAITGGASASSPWQIKVYPGTYTEDPMTIQSGIVLSTEWSNRMTTVYVVANNANEDLFTCTGGYIAGIVASGVTDAAKALFRMATASTLTVLHGVSLRGCSTGIAVSNGASVVLTNFSIQLTGLGQGVTTGISVTGSGSYVGLVGGFFSVPAALLPGYASNPIQTVIRNASSGKVFIVGAAFSIAYKDTTADVVLADGGSITNLLSCDINNSSTGVHIGAGGSNTKVIVQGCSFLDNNLNGKNDSSTGAVMISATARDFKWSSVAGGVLSGIAQLQDYNTTYLTGLLGYHYPTGVDLQLDEWFHDQSSTGLTYPETPVTINSGLDVDVPAAHGYVTRHTPDHDIVTVSWSADTLTLNASTTNYVVYDYTTTALAVLTSPPGEEAILLATAITDGSGVRFLHQTRNFQHNNDKRLHDYLLSTRAILLNNGLVASAGTSGRKFQIATGSYYRALDLISYAGSGGDATFSYFYGSGGATEVPSQTQVDNTQYDSSGTLTNMTAGYFRSDTVLITSDGRVSVIYGTAEYTTQLLAEAAPLANIPSFIEPTGCKIARLIVQQGGNIVAILDERPVSAVRGSGASGVTVHADLAGLSADDHVQYLLASGSRSMAGSLDMGGNSVTNVNLVDGVDVSSHGSRHNPGAADAITTAIPVATQVGAAAAEGTASSLARSDHQHGIASGTPVNIGTANAAGTASSASRSDHVHAHGDQTVGTLHAAATTSVNGFMSATDKTKLDGIATGATNTPLSNTVPVNVTKAAASAGAATDASRRDHKHDVSTAAPSGTGVRIGNTASEGTATTLARSDHSHTVTGGSPVSVGAALADGTALTFARADHVHTGLTRGSGDFNSFTAKTVPVNNDVVLIEDSAATYAKKKTTIQQIRDGMGGLPLQSAYVGLESNISTTSLYSSYVDMPGMTTTVVTTKATSILRCELTCCYSNSNAKNVYFRITIAGARVKGTAGSSAANALQTAALTFHHTVTAGSHEVKVQWCTAGGTVSCNPVGGLGTEGDYHHCSLLVQELA